jgi:hypothetical protein
LRAGKEAEVVAHEAGDGPVMGAEPMAKDATIEIVTRENSDLSQVPRPPALVI